MQALSLQGFSFMIKKKQIFPWALSPPGFSYMVDVEVSETGCLLQEDFSLESCQPEVEIRNNKIKERSPKIEKKRYLPVLNSFAGTWYEVVHRWGPRGPPAAEAGTRSWAEEDWGRDDDGDGDIYIMMKCVSVCNEKWSLPPGSLL